jgi:hypothetical protein
MDTAFNVWYDQRGPDVAALIDELCRGIRGVVKPPSPRR